MKTANSNDNFVNTITNSKATSFGIDVENQAFIIEALSKNIYRDPIGTIIREYSSNAWDANVEAGVDEPILVQLDTDATGTFFSVTDFGVGLSQDRVANVFTKYGKSTKGGDNSGIGGFGIGAKSAFSYSDSFFINTIHDGVFYKYLLTKTSKEPSMMLLVSEPTELKNGTEIRIYVKNSNDKHQFDEKINKQLLHFKNVIYKMDGVDVEAFSNREFHDGEGIEISTSSKRFFSNTYVLLGPVAYPIDYQLLGEQPINLPIGLKFEIGELDVTLSREEIRYTEETIEALKKKLKWFKDEIQKYYDNRSWWLKDVHQYYQKTIIDQVIEFGDLQLPLPDSIKIKRKEYHIVGLPTEMKFPKRGKIPFLRSACIFDGNSISSIEEKLPVVDYNLLISNDFDIYFNDESGLSRNKLRYLHSVNSSKKILVLRKQKMSYLDYRLLLTPNRKVVFEKGNFLRRVLSFKKVFEDVLLKDIKKLSDITVPKTFLQQNKVEKAEKFRGAKFNDLLRPFGESFRKVRLENGIFDPGDGNKKFRLENIVVMLGTKEDVELVKRTKNSNLVNFIYRNADKVKHKKTVLYLSLEKEKDVEVLIQNKIKFYDLKSYLQNLRVPKKVKDYVKSVFYDANFLNNEFYHFLVKMNLINKIQFNPTQRYNSGYDEYIFFTNILKRKINHLDYIDQSNLYLLKKVERLTKHFKMYKILNLSIDLKRDKEMEELLYKILRKNGIAPSLKSYSPINNWETELFVEAESKTKYLQSL